MRQDGDNTTSGGDQQQQPGSWAHDYQAMDSPSTTIRRNLVRRPMDAGMRPVARTRRCKAQSKHQHSCAQISTGPAHKDSPDNKVPFARSRFNDAAFPTLSGMRPAILLFDRSRARSNAAAATATRAKRLVQPLMSASRKPLSVNSNRTCEQVVVEL